MGKDDDSDNAYIDDDTGRKMRFVTRIVDYRCLGIVRESDKDVFRANLSMRLAAGMLRRSARIHIRKCGNLRVDLV